MGRGSNTHGLVIAVGVLDGADIVPAPALVTGVAEIALPPRAIGGAVVAAPVAIPAPADLAVFVEGDDLRGAGREGEAEGRGGGLALVGALAFGRVAGFVPDDDGDGGGAAVLEGVGVVVGVGGGDEAHVAAVGGADVAGVGVDVGAGDGVGAGAEAGGRAAAGLVEDGAGVGGGAGLGDGGGGGGGGGAGR